MAHAANKGKIMEMRKSLDNEPLRNDHFEDSGGNKKLKSRKCTIMAQAQRAGPNGSAV